MAVLELKIDGVTAYKDQSSTSAVTGCLSLKSNNSDGEFTYTEGGNEHTINESICFAYKNDDIQSYKVHMTNVDFKKKMYVPTEIIVVLNIYPLSKPSNTSGPAPKPKWYPLAKNYIVELFKDKKVTLQTEDKKVVGDDFYVEDILPRYKKDSMFVMLRIYSPDHQMALTQASAAFVGKRLGDDILEEELKKYFKPWTVDAQIPVLEKKIDNKLKEIAALEEQYKQKPNDDNRIKLEGLKDEADKLKKEKEEKESNREIISYDIKMKVLSYEHDGSTYEHMFPYLVQYNEPFYDLLKRTTNRWGEFLYYENGQLNVGYDDTQVAEEITGWYSLNYCDLESHLRTDNTDKTYDAEAAYDENIVNSPIKKDPSVIKNLPGCSVKNGLDTWLMKTFASFFANTKSITTWIASQTFDNLYNLASQAINNKYVDNELSKQYFKDEDESEFKTQYGPDKEGKMSFSQFTELNTKYLEEFYREVLKREQFAIQRGICINYATTYPNLKLGQIIKVDGEDYLVINVECETKNSVIISDDLWVVDSDTTPELHFKVTAVGRYDDGKPENDPEKDDNFYPTMLPSGHIRTSGPQLAQVWDADDPLNQNRVRIHFAWQHIVYDEGEDQTDEEEADEVASPWLVYATSAASKSNGIFGKHYKADAVIVDFSNGNVENPYIVGGLAMKGNKVPGSLAERDIVLSSPGGHTLRMDDGSGAGLTAFLTGTVLPGYDLITTFFPMTGGKDIFSSFDSAKGTMKYFEGGFQLTDKYGIYTISGSTDGRNVTVKSPWGDVGISAFTGISISAPNGDIEIKGKNVKIEAGNNLELISGGNIDSPWHPRMDGLTAAGIASTLASIGADITTAVAKKVANLGATFVDFSFYRNLFEVVFRPIEGTMTVKSNRFLKLEAGEDSCDFPLSGYKNDEVRADIRKDAQEEKVLAGLSLADGVAVLIKKTKSIADDIDKEFISLYNDCVKKHNNFKREVQKARKYANGFHANRDVVICDSVTDVANLWADNDNLLVENDLNFDNHDYKTASAQNDVTIECINACTNPNSGLTEYRRKEVVIRKRNEHKQAILSAANELRRAVIRMMKMSELSDAAIKKKVGSIYYTNVPNNYLDAMKKAFKKGNLGNDTFYYNCVGKFTDEQKGLGSEASRETFKTYRHALRRKAATILLEEVGFQDGWRVPIDNQPAAPVKDITEAHISVDQNWTNYVNSLSAFPTFEKFKESALRKGLTGPFKEHEDDYNPTKIWKVLEENKVWENKKAGSVLFTANGATYQLGAGIAAVNPVPAPAPAATAQGTLVPSIDPLDHVAGDDDHKKVKKAMNGIKDALKKL